MNPATLLIIEALLKYGPVLATSLVELLSKDTAPTKEEWIAVFKLAEKSYEDYTK